MAIRITESHDKFTLASGIDGANIFFASNDVLRALENTGLGLCRNLLRIAHVNSIVLDKTVLATIAEGCPLLCHSRYLYIARYSRKQHSTVGGCKFDIAISGFGIIYPEGNIIKICFFQTIISQNLLVVKEYCYLTATTCYV